MVTPGHIRPKTLMTLPLAKFSQDQIGNRDLTKPLPVYSRPILQNFTFFGQNDSITVINNSSHSFQKLLIITYTV